MNTAILFNEQWSFVKTNLETQSCTDLAFEPVAVPHDWLIYDTTNLYENSIGWYKKEWHYDGSFEQVILQFDGVYMDSSLFVNGQFIGEWKYGYTTFEYDITSALQIGENDIIMKVVHQSPNSRWYTGAGIYRNVWLKLRGNNFIETDGIYVSTIPARDGWDLEIDTDLHATEDLHLSHTLYNGNKIISSCSQNISAPLNKQKMNVKEPLLWSPGEPNLYQLKTTLHKKDILIESVQTPVGFRKIEMSPDTGFAVNGVKTKLNGVCEHHDLGALGSAFNPLALRRRLTLLKQMGVNSIRTAHNMPAKELMEMADEMGFFIVSEAFDMWERPKTDYDYARFFKDWAYKDIKNWVKRDRNHPSLIMWSIGNEIYDTHADQRGVEIAEMLMAYVEEFDPRQNARVTIGSNYMPWENAQNVADVVKVAGYNYAEKYYKTHHDEHPDWIIYGSETASIVQSRGIYHFPYHQPILADDDLQCSALGNSSTSWGAKSAEACIIAERDTPFSLGQFIWTGFDYIGEPTPYHTKNSYFGQIDTATFPKDSYYIYQANWTSYKEAPMIHIFPYWDFNPGQLIDIRIATNAPKFELYLNDQLLETREINHGKDMDLIPTIRVPYQPGELKAVAYDGKGNVIAEDSQHSFNDPSSLVLQPDKESLFADGLDLIFVEIATADSDNYTVMNAQNRVTVDVSGAGRLIGLDNGDSSDYDQYKGTSRRLFSGKLMAIIAATDEVGEINVTVTSEGLKDATLILSALPSQEIKQIVFEKNQFLPIQIGQDKETPIRKIELISENQHLSTENRILKVAAVIHPAHATYHDLEWSVVNDAGIPSNIAKIEAMGNDASVTAIGDGEFRVRCTSKNGTTHVSLISELEISISGLGQAYKNPYAFISGGLYDYKKGEVTNGNERGVATSRDGETQVGYRDIDFGTTGSDTITLPLFTLSDAVYALQIWDGVPEDTNSTLLLDDTYQKPSIWNVYQPETYQLKKQVTGLTDLYFVFKDKVHIKGFTFEPYNRAFKQNNVTEADNMYGDSFAIKDQAVENIGNNVSFIFNDMDFLEQGANKLTIFGSSPIEKNTILVRLEDADGTESQLIEFNQSDGYEERSFDIQNISGKKTITFIFLPGSNFNFGWFRFLS